MKKTIKTIITTAMAFVWLYMFTFRLGLSIIMALATGAAVYLIGTIEEDEESSREAGHLDNKG